MQTMDSSAAIDQLRFEVNLQKNITAYDNNQYGCRQCKINVININSSWCIDSNYISITNTSNFVFFFFGIRSLSAELIEECIFEQFNEIEGTISHTDINDTYKMQVTDSLDCLWMIEVKPGWQVRNTNTTWLTEFARKSPYLQLSRDLCFDFNIIYYYYHSLNFQL